MKFLQIIAIVGVFSVAGIPVLSAQEPSQEEKKQQDEKKKQPPPAKPNPQPKAEEKAKSEPRPRKQETETQKQQQKEAQKEQDKAAKHQQKQSTSQGNQSAAPRKNVRRIPPERFQASFGSQHHFHVQQRSDHRIQYGGYWFEYVEVWPAGWSYDDDCYIEADGDDYYLIDVVHPEVRLLIVVVE